MKINSQTVYGDLTPDASGQGYVGSQATAWGEVNATVVRGDFGYFSNISQVASLDITPTLSDHSYIGLFETATSGENLIFGDVCYLKSDGKYWKADANQSTTMPVSAIATATINTTTGVFLKYGYIKDVSLYNWTTGSLLYVSAASTGTLTNVAPSGTGDQVQVVGYAHDADTVFFNPSYVLVEIV